MTTQPVALTASPAWTDTGSAAARWAPRPARTLRARVVIVRYAGMAALALAVGALHLPRRPATLCLFREFTGLPCPLCGGTTAAVDLGHADPRAALAASPLAVAMFATVPLIGALAAPRWWQRRSVRWIAIVSVLGVSEIWQLARFGIIHA
ncbi:MAG TPA: DUF2752 domain-containing protein [Mycobacteriales bacterium]|nr:DUF2752 domain-containing protein [Mycobacteriales bacterium]